MGIAGAAEDTPDQDVRDQFEVNYFGVLRVNRQVVPLLRQAGKGLVVITGSVAGRIPIPYQSHYSATKYALDAYAECLRMELKPFGVRVTLIEPGDTATGFTAARRFAVPADSPYAAPVRSAVARMERDERAGHPAAKPARAALQTASREHPPTRVTIGASYRAIMALRRALPARALEAILSRLYR
jgi:short-subunit dehydrogenase